jgi:hypothetical protein
MRGLLLIWYSREADPRSPKTIPLRPTVVYQDLYERPVLEGKQFLRKPVYLRLSLFFKAVPVVRGFCS